MRKNYITVIEQRQAELDARARSFPESVGPVFASTGNQIRYQLSDRTQAVACGGIGLIQRFVSYLALPTAIDKTLSLLKRHLPYHESDHILNIVYCLLSGGSCIEDIKLRRNDPAYLSALDAMRIPDSTTAGDFLRRFKAKDVEALMDAINEVRRDIWLQQPAAKRAMAVFDVDGTIAETTGQCKEGAAFAYNGKWGYGPLLVTLANSGGVMYLVNRGANRPSHDGAPEWLDKAEAWAESAGFKRVRFRGDTDFSLTAEFDRWTEKQIEFVFGIDAHPSFVKMANQLEEDRFQPLVRNPKWQVETKPRQRPFNFKQAAVVERGYKNKRLQAESVAVIDSYKPTKAGRTYRLVILRKNISVEKGEQLLFDEIAYFFYVTNTDMEPQDVVFEANARCNQENIIKQMKSSGVDAFKAPAVEFVANWAYMVIAALAWNLKAWLALTLPHRLGSSDLLRMGMRRFINEVILVPAQILRTGRRLVFRLLSANKRARLLIEGSLVLAR